MGGYATHYPFCLPSCISQEIKNIIDIQCGSSNVQCILNCTFVQKLDIKGSVVHENSKQQGQTLVSDHCEHCFGFALNFGA